MQGTTLTEPCYTTSSQEAQQWLKRGVLASRLGYLREAVVALDQSNAIRFSLHAWMAKLQLLTSMGPADDMHTLRQAMMAHCRVSLFLEEFNRRASVVQSDSYLRKAFFVLVGRHGLSAMRQVINMIRRQGKRNVNSATAKEDVKRFVDGKQVALPGLVVELMNNAYRWRAFGYDR